MLTDTASANASEDPKWPLLNAAVQAARWTGLLWSTYNQIFHADELTKLLYGRHSVFFRVAKLAIEREVVSGCARLMDPDTTGKQVNASLPKLAEELGDILATEKSGKCELLKKIECECDILKKIESARDFYKKSSIFYYRNKVVSHSDYEVSTDLSGDPVGFKKCEMDKLVQMINTIICRTCLAYPETNLDITDGGDGVASGLKESLTDAARLQLLLAILQSDGAAKESLASALSSQTKGTRTERKQIDGLLSDWAGSETRPRANDPRWEMFKR